MKKKLNIQEYKGIEDLVEDQVGVKIGDEQEWYDVLEKERLDTTFHIDKDLESLLDYLYDGGHTEKEIIEMNKARYGKIVEFYYLKDEDSYVMEYGQR